MDKKFHQFKLVKIQGSFEALFAREFVHPIYKGKQKLLFSEDFNFMFEELENDRCFLYQWQAEEAGSTTGKWKLVRKLVGFPTDLEAHHCYRSIHSPDLQHYVDWSEKDQAYLIMSMVTQKKLMVIPRNIVDPENLRRSRVITNRIKWYSNDQLLVVNKEGAERLVRMTPDGFVEEAFNMWPEFERENIPAKQEIYHLYDEMRGISPHDPPSKIHRQLIHHKRAYNLFKAKTQEEMYQYLFSIETGSQELGYGGVPRVQLTFSILDWKIMELVRDGRFSIHDFNSYRQDLIIHTILPNQKTLLHFMVGN